MWPSPTNPITRHAALSPKHRSTCLQAAFCSQQPPPPPLFGGSTAAAAQACAPAQRGHEHRGAVPTSVHQQQAQAKVEHRRAQALHRRLAQQVVGDLMGGWWWVGECRVSAQAHLDSRLGV